MRDGRRKRLGLVEGSEGTVGDTYLDRILTDAEATENPYTIAADTDVNFDTRDFRNISDTYNYYYGGGADAATVPATPTTPGTGDGGSSDGGTGGGGGGTTPSTNTPFEDYLIDEGIGVQAEPGAPISAPGEGMLTQDAIDDLADYPITNVAEFPTGDASLAEQIEADRKAAKALADEQALTNRENYIMSQYDSPTPTYYDGTATLEDAGAGEGDMYTTDFQGGEPLSFDDRNESIEDIDRVSAPYGRNPITGEAYETPRSIADQNAVLGQTFEEDDVDADGNLVQKGIDKVKGLLPEGFDLGSVLVKTAINAAIGKPVFLLIDILKNALPEQDPRKGALDDLYDMDGITIGSGLMKGYNPVSGGFLNTITKGRYGEPTQYGLQEAYQDRIDTITESLNKFDKYDPNSPDYDPVKTKQQIDKRAKLEKDKAKEAALLNRYEGDINPEGTGDGSVMESVYDAPTVETIDTGVLTEDDDDFVIGDETPVDINGNVINNNTNVVDVQAVKDAIKKAEDRDRIAEVTRQNEIARQTEIDRLAAEAIARAAENRGGNSGGNNDRSGGRSSSSGESDYGGFCFDPNTLIQMTDGSNKKIKNIQLGDNTKGGEVTGVFQFKATDEIHNYKGVTVAGSHYVKEDGKFIMVQDSPLAFKIDKIPVVYSLDTTGRRIFINNIEFADYNGDGVAKNFLNNAGVDLTGFDTEVLRQVEQRLI